MKAHLLLFGMSPLVVHCERISPTVLRLPPAAHSLEVLLDERAEGFSNLVVFEGYLLRDGMPGGAKPLDFVHQGTLYHPGEYIIEKKLTAGMVSPFDSTTGEDRNQDEVAIEGGVAEIWYKLYAIQFPRAKSGSRGLIMRPKDRSLQRDYLRIVSTPEKVIFESCVTF